MGLEGTQDDEITAKRDIVYFTMSLTPLFLSIINAGFHEAMHYVVVYYALVSGSVLAKLSPHAKAKNTIFNAVYSGHWRSIHYAGYARA